MDAVTVLPVLAASLVVFVILIKLYQGIRVKLPKRVNCWFCNKNTRVPYRYKDSWKCPSCEQYNGFAPDGGYNRILLAQYNVALNKTTCQNTPKKPSSPIKNELCRYCNINQELKVAQLAAFVPVEPSNFDEEVDFYRQQLDKAYRLCTKCENVLSEKLLKQKSWIENLYQDFGSFLNKKSETMSQMKSRRIYYAYFSAIISAGLFLSAASHFQLSQEMTNYATSRLQLLTATYPFPEIPELLDMLSRMDKLSPWVNLNNMPVLLTGLSTLVQLLEAFEEQDIASGLNVIMWLILNVLSVLSSQNTGLVAVVEMLAGGVTFVVSVIHIKELKLAKLRAAQSFNKSNVAASPDTPVHRVLPLSETKPDRPKSPSIPNSKMSQPFKTSPNFNPISSKIPKTSQSFTSYNTFNPSFTTTLKNSQSFTSHNCLHTSPKSAIPDDLGLSKLNLGAKKTNNKQHPTFETRSYGNRLSNDLFRPVLSPPKLSVESVYFDRQTRSSSQSSGFYSSASQRCDTTPPSVVGDFDTASNDGCSIASYPRPVPMYQYPMYPVSPYVHFATEFHRMYQPVPTPALFDSSYNSNGSGTFQFIRNTLYSLPITLLVLSNLALVWIVVYKEFVVR